MMKNFLCSVLLGALSVSLLAGGCAEMAVEADKPVSLLEDMGQPTLAFSFAGHQGRIFKLPDPPPNRDFVGTGGLAVFAHISREKNTVLPRLVVAITAIMWGFINTVSLSSVTSI